MDWAEYFLIKCWRPDEINWNAFEPLVWSSYLTHQCIVAVWPCVTLALALALRGGLLGDRSGSMGLYLSHFNSAFAFAQATQRRSLWRKQPLNWDTAHVLEGYNSGYSTWLRTQRFNIQTQSGRNATSLVLLAVTGNVKITVWAWI